MTWEELKEKAKKIGFYWVESNFTGSQEWITDGLWCFEQSGLVKFNNEWVSMHRTPEQMLAIMKALQ